jgi:hypothetical protein
MSNKLTTVVPRCVLERPINWLTRGVELHHIIARGGWDFEGVNNVFHYLLQILQNVNVGGRALSGWSDCKSGAYLPRLVFMNEENAPTVDT